MEERSTMPERARKALRDASNVTGGEFGSPGDLGGYLDEPRMRFGLWVGETEEDAELVAFEVNGDQIHDIAEAFSRASDAARELEEES